MKGKVPRAPRCRIRGVIFTCQVRSPIPDTGSGLYLLAT